VRRPLVADISPGHLNGKDADQDDERLQDKGVLSTLFDASSSLTPHTASKTPYHGLRVEIATLPDFHLHDPANLSSNFYRSWCLQMATT
jgi:hypothetical protein